MQDRLARIKSNADMITALQHVRYLTLSCEFIQPVDRTLPL